MNEDTLIRTLCGLHTYHGPGHIWPKTEVGRRLLSLVLPKGVRVYREVDRGTAMEPGHWRHNAYTLQGYGALHAISDLYHQVVRDCVPGELVECGVWRGGVGMLLAQLSIYYNHVVRLCDTFDGLPPRSVGDEGDLHRVGYLAVSLKEVIDGFRTLQIPLDNVKFEGGVFSESLPRLVKRKDDLKIALLHIDCDLYSSTMDVLDNLYPRVSPGGVIVMDDWFEGSQAGRAVMAYFNKNGLPLPTFTTIDSNSCYWIKR